MVKNIIHILALTFTLPLLGSGIAQGSRNIGLSDITNIEGRKIERKTPRKAEDSPDDEFLNNIYLGFGGEKIEPCGNYVLDYRKSDILEARDEAKKTDSGTAIIKESIIGASYSKLSLRVGLNKNIIGANLIKCSNTWLPILREIINLDKLSHQLSDDDDSAEVDIKINDKIEELEKEIVCEVDKNPKLLNYFCDPGEASYALLFLSCVENALKPHVKFDKSGMPYGSYLSHEVIETILELIEPYCDEPDEHDNFKCLVEFPLWLQKLLQTSCPYEALKMNYDCHRERYPESRAHPFLSIMNLIQGGGISSDYSDLLTEREKSMLGKVKEFMASGKFSRCLSIVEQFLNALGFRALLLTKDLEEFEIELTLNCGNSKVCEFISELREEHISQFIDQAEIRFGDIRYYMDPHMDIFIKEEFINSVAPELRKVPELKGFFG